MYSNSTEETKGSVKILHYLTLCVCEILSSLVCACQAALPSIWMTLMKGERGNNQRSQYFTLDTDACSYAAGRRDLLAAQPSSDLTLEFTATFLSLQLTRLAFSRSPSAPSPTPAPHLPLSTWPACLPAWLQLKGKCSSGEVRCLHHKVLGPTMWPGPPNILLLHFSSSSSSSPFSPQYISWSLSTWLTSSQREW